MLLSNSDTTQRLIPTVGYILVVATRVTKLFGMKMLLQDPLILSRMFNSKLDLITETGLR